jgi:bifunctional non-homologous end joining protein LigD
VRRELVAKLDQHRRDISPFVEVPRADARDARWVQPKLVAEVEFKCKRCLAATFRISG